MERLRSIIDEKRVEEFKVWMEQEPETDFLYLAVDMRGNARHEDTSTVDIDDIIDIAIDQPMKSGSAMREAIHRDDFELADRLWDHKHCFNNVEYMFLLTLDRMKWARAHQMDFSNFNTNLKTILKDSTDGQLERVRFLFQEVGWFHHFNVEMLKFCYSAKVFLYLLRCVDLEDDGRRAMEIAYEHSNIEAIAWLMGKGFSLVEYEFPELRILDTSGCVQAQTIKKTPAGISSFDDIKYFCAIADLPLEQAFIPALWDQREDEIAVAILNQYFEEIHSVSNLLSLAVEKKLFERLVDNYLFDAAKCLGKRLRGHGYQPDFPYLMDRYFINVSKTSGRCSLGEWAQLNRDTMLEFEKYIPEFQLEENRLQFEQLVDKCEREGGFHDDCDILLFYGTITSKLLSDTL